MSTRAEAVTPPYESNNVIVLSGNTTAQRMRLPDGWRREYVTVTAIGVNAGVLFGDDGVVADITATTTVTSEVPAINATACAYVASGTSGKPWDLAQIVPHHKNLYVSIDCDATAGTVRLERSSGKVKAS